jgi:hypothetical protein
MKALNDERGLRAGEDRRRLLDAARPVFEELTELLGKPPGRVWLARGLADAGIEVPTRRVAELLDGLRT